MARKKITKDKPLQSESVRTKALKPNDRHGPGGRHCGAVDQRTPATPDGAQHGNRIMRGATPSNSRQGGPGIEEGVRDAICGHAPETEGDKYEKPTVKDMANALKQFPRYEID